MVRSKDDFQKAGICGNAYNRQSDGTKAEKEKRVKTSQEKVKIVSLSNATIIPLNLEGYKIHSSSALEVIHLCLKPGQDIPLHANQFDIVACLIKGEVTLNMGESNIPLALYDTVEVEKNMDRGFTNYGTIEARLIIIKKL